jgi:ABC-2 type transport system permease protein
VPGSTPAIPPSERPVRVVSATPTLTQRISDIWGHRELLSYLIRTEIKVKYKASALGIAWSMVNPAMVLGIYFLVFQVFMKNGVPNYVFMLGAGLVVWNFFAVTVNTTTSVIVNQAGIVKKVAFPREILVLASIGTSLVYLLIQFGVLLGLMAIVGHAPAWGMLWLLPLAVLALVLLTSALGIVLSAVNVYMRDTKHFVEIGMQLWFWLTPIVYSFEQKLSPLLHRHGLTWIFFLNPVTPIVMAFQRVLYAQAYVHSTVAPHALFAELPTWPASTYLELVGGIIIASSVGLLGAITLFGRLEGNFAEEL